MKTREGPKKHGENEILYLFFFLSFLPFLPPHPLDGAIQIRYMAWGTFISRMVCWDGKSLPKGPAHSNETITPVLNYIPYFNIIDVNHIY